jgi:hypothetical protein
MARVLLYRFAFDNPARPVPDGAGDPTPLTLKMARCPPKKPSEKCSAYTAKSDDGLACIDNYMMLFFKYLMVITTGGCRG